MPGFTFATWNSGTSRADYLQLFERRREANINWWTPEFIVDINNVRDKLLADTALDLSRRADVLALQEVSGNIRTDLDVYEENGFVIIQFSPFKSDTAIAIRNNKFSDIENHSFTTSDGCDVAVVIATEIATGKKICFVSGHFAGFNLEADEKSMSEGAESGNQEIEETLRRLDDIVQDCDTVMLGADMNAIVEKYKARFDYFADAGFTCYRTNAPTSLFSLDFQGNKPQIPNRELDYIFVAERKINFLDKIKRIFIRSYDYVCQLTGNDYYTLNPISCPSDHIPLFLRVDAFVQTNYFSRLISKIASCFGN